MNVSWFLLLVCATIAVSKKGKFGRFDDADADIVSEMLAKHAARFRNSTTLKKMHEKMANIQSIPLNPRFDRVKNQKTSIPQINSQLLADVYQGDIRLTVEQARILLNESRTDSSRPKRQAFVNSQYPATLWRNASGVPYVSYRINSSLTSATANLIRKAVKFWQDNTCITFVENGPGTNQLEYFQGGGCWSYIGRLSTMALPTTQPVSIGDGCEHFGIITHETGHALGFYHGQSRYDRDSYVTVNIANVQSGTQFNYDKETTATNYNYGVAYDYGSVMHYASEDFAIDDNVPVLIATVSPLFQETMGSRVGPSFSDVREMNLHYQCNACASSKTACQNGGYPDPRNCAQCKCPWGFGGTLCTQRQAGVNGAPSTCGATVTATTDWQSLSGEAGDGVQTLRDDMAACFWWIQSPAGTTIQITRNFIGYICTSGCFYGGVEINTNADLRSTGPRFCCTPDGDNSTTTSATNLVVIAAFNRYYKSGFNIQYRIAGSDTDDTTTSAATTTAATTSSATSATTTTSSLFCGGSFGVSGTITSPNYPANYGNNQNCTYVLTASAGKVVSLAFNSFSTDANFDFVQLFDGPSTSSAQIQTLTGRPITSTYVSTGRTMTVLFTSDYTGVFTGFSARFSSVPSITCPKSNSFTRSATISSPGYPGSYVNNMACTYYMTSAASRRARITFTTFFTEYSDDYLHVYDGPNTESPLLSSLTGNLKVPIIFNATGTTMTLQFISDSSIVQPGWSLQFTSF